MNLGVNSGRTASRGNKKSAIQARTRSMADYGTSDGLLRKEAVDAGIYLFSISSVGTEYFLELIGVEYSMSEACRQFRTPARGY